MSKPDTETKPKPDKKSFGAKMQHSFNGPSYGPISAVLVTIFGYLFAQVCAAIFISLGASIFGYDPEKIFDDLTNSTIIQTTYIFLFQAILLYVLWVFMKFRRISYKTIGLGRLPKLSDLQPAVVTFVVYFAVLLIVTSILTYFVTGIDTDQQQDLGFENVINIRDIVLVFISLVVIPPIAEEILVRGFLYSGLRVKYTKVLSAIIASLIFGVAHLQLGSGNPPLWIAAIDTTLLSLFLIHLRERTGSLWSGMMVHAMKNGLAFFVLFVVK